MKKARDVSFPPAATEMVSALGIGDQLAGWSHECDLPAEPSTKPVVDRSALLESMSLSEIGSEVAQRIGSGDSVEQLDETSCAVPASKKSGSGVLVKTCPECGSAFECRMGGCWCQELPSLPRGSLRASDCLCPGCLAQAVKAAAL